MAALNRKQERLELRATSEQRMLLDKATAASGLNRSDFVLQAAMREAREVLEQQSTITLNDHEFDSFMVALDSPMPANDELKAALKIARESGIE